MMSSIHYFIYPEQNLIVAKASGQITFSDVKGFIQSLFSDPEHRMGMDCFLDASQVVGMQGNLEHYLEATDIIANVALVNVPSKTAIIIEDNNVMHANLVKGFILMTSASNTEHRAFKMSNKRDALEFLGITELPGT